MLVVDISKDRQFDSIWEKTLEKIALGDDRLKSNYTTLDPTSFACFTALIDKDEIVCFSALQISSKKWGDKIARCSTRMWISPEKRFNGMTKFSHGSKFLNSYYCLPLQIAEAKKLGIECLFMSRDENPIAFAKFSELVNNNCGTQFICLKDRYNVCGNLNPIPHSCKQYISIDMSLDNSLKIWNNNMERFCLKEDSNLDYTKY